jgi:hypothetical protein
MARIYTHQLKEEIFSIGGRYEIEKEEKIEHNGRALLYVIGQYVIDSSCCGYGGSRYVIIPSFIVNWKSGTNENGIPTSVIETIEDEETKKELVKLIKEKEGVSQVQFW